MLHWFEGGSTLKLSEGCSPAIRSPKEAKKHPSTPSM
jgi:hypothetical protein